MLCEIPEFGRCCCCLPLRHGIILLGCLNIVFYLLMMLVNTYAMSTGFSGLPINPTSMHFEDEICLLFYSADVIFNSVLVYGGLAKHMLCLKVFYCYALSTLFATILMELMGVMREDVYFWEVMPLFLFGLSLNLYLLFMVRSLLKKLEMSGQTFENQLQQFVNGEFKAEGNSIYPSTVVPNNT